METLSLDLNTADLGAPYLLVGSDHIVGRIREEADARDIVRACNAYEALLLAVKAQHALEGVPFKQGEDLLKACGWNGEEDITQFAKNLRVSALKAAGQLQAIEDVA